MKKLLLVLIGGFMAVSVSFSQQINWQWARGATGPGAEEGWASTTDRSGNIYVTGSFTGESITFGNVTLYYNSPPFLSMATNLFVVKYSSAGDLLWAKSPISTDTGWIVGFGIATDENNNVFVTGSYSGDKILFNSGYLPASKQNMNSVLILKYDSAGNELWAEGAGGLWQDYGSGVACDDSGNAYVTGSFDSDSITFGTSTFYRLGEPGSYNIFIAKYNSAGQVIWAESPTVSTSSQNNEGFGVATDGIGDVYATGYYQGGWVKFGNITLPSVSSAGLSVYLVKFNGAGNVQWAKQVGGSDVVTGITADSAGNVILTGNFRSGTIAFDANTSLTNQSQVSADYYVVKYDPNGNVLWARGSNGCYQCSGDGVATDKCGNVYVGGGFEITPSYHTISIADTIIDADVSFPDPIFMVTYNAAGQALCVSVLASGGDDVFGVSLDQSGNAYIGSDFESEKLIAASDTLSLTGIENIYVAKFNCPTCSITGGCESLEYQLSSSGLCRGDSVVIDFADATGINISPGVYVAWLDSVHAALFPDTTTVFTISGYLPCGSATMQTLTLTVLGDSVKVTSDKDVICPGDSAQLCATIGFTNYNWNTDENTACIYAHNAGDYYVTATAAANCSAISAPVFLNEYPAPSVSILVEGDTLASYGAAGYQWFLNGTAINGATGPVYIARTGGSYELQVTDTNGCTALSSAVTITGINEITADKVSVYPNPSTGSWGLIVGDNMIGNEAEVFDAEGRLVYKAQIWNPRSEISFDAASGIYTLRITGDGFIVIKKLARL